MEPDPFRDHALVLTIDGVEQSHIDVADPGDLALEYVRRIGFLLDAFATPAAPLSVLHLGGGGLTLARYVAATRPGSEQVVVEAEPGLIDFVTEVAPLPVGAVLEVVEGDAFSALPRGRLFDVVIVDVYVGLEVPGHLMAPHVVAAVADVCAGGGFVAVNVADEAAAPLARSWRRLFAERFANTALLASPSVFRGDDAGNVVLLASGGDGFVEIVGDLLRRGPHPVAAGPEGDVVVVQVPVEVDP